MLLIFVEGSAKNIIKVLKYYKIESDIENTLQELNKTNIVYYQKIFKYGR